MADSTLVFLFLCTILHTSNADEAFWWKCSNTNGNYTTNSTYETNVNLVLSYLSSRTHFTGFSNVSLGSTPNRVQGLALCRGDVNSAACRDCVASAAYDARIICPFRKDATIWYSNCHIRYSNEQFLSVMNSTVAQAFVNVKKVNASQFERFNLSVVTLLNSLAEYAVYNSTSPPLFAVGRMIYESTEYPRLYGLVQCTRDIAAAECYQCLQDMIGAYLRCCPDNIGKRFIARSCTFVSELDPRSYNWSVELLYPPVKVIHPSSPSPSPSPSPSALPAPESSSTAIQALSGSVKHCTYIRNGIACCGWPWEPLDLDRAVCIAQSRSRIITVTAGTTSQQRILSAYLTPITTIFYTLMLC